MASRRSSLSYILMGLVPFTEENMLLAFKPNKFFNELERVSDYSAASLRATYSRAKQQQLFEIAEDKITLSLKARQKIQPYIARRLTNGKLMVIFDIPEDFATARKSFRTLLKHLEFRQIQQSVWMSDQDHRQILKETISDLNMGDWIQVYEAVRL